MGEHLHHLFSWSIVVGRRARSMISNHGSLNRHAAIRPADQSGTARHLRRLCTSTPLQEGADAVLEESRRILELEGIAWRRVASMPRQRMILGPRGCSPSLRFCHSSRLTSKLQLQLCQLSRRARATQEPQKDLRRNLVRGCLLSLLRPHARSCPPLRALSGLWVLPFRSRGQGLQQAYARLTLFRFSAAARSVWDVTNSLAQVQDHCAARLALPKTSMRR